MPRIRNADALKTTPVKMPTSPGKWYDVNRSAQGDLQVAVTPSAKTRRNVIYTWRITFADGSHKDYNGKTIQVLTKRCRQHIRQAKKATKTRDLFHRFLKEFAENLPNSQVVKIQVGVSRVVPPAESVTKTEQLFIAGKDSLIPQRGGKGCNQINACKELADRITKGKIFIQIAKAVAGFPRQLIIQRKP